MATTRDKRGGPKGYERDEDPRFGKARNPDPPDPYHDSTSIAKEPPRLDVARRRELEDEERRGTSHDSDEDETTG